ERAWVDEREQLPLLDDGALAVADLHQLTVHPRAQGDGGDGSDGAQPDQKDADIALGDLSGLNGHQGWWSSGLLFGVPGGSEHDGGSRGAADSRGEPSPGRQGCPRSHEGAAALRPLANDTSRVLD